MLQNNWIVEIAELSSLNKADNNTVKQIITQTSDEYRAAYARSTEKHKRHSVFFGTTNDMEYLKDPTGKPAILADSLRTETGKTHLGGTDTAGSRSAVGGSGHLLAHWRAADPVQRGGSHC